MAPLVASLATVDRATRRERPTQGKRATGIVEFTAATRVVKPMQMRSRLEALIDEMLDGQIRLDEALGEFERVYIQKALKRNSEHLSNTAKVLGIHRNTLSKRVADYDKEHKAMAMAKRAGR